MAKTFKNLQDDVLEWMADQADDGLMLTLVKQAIDNSQRVLLTDEQYDFMLTPARTLSVTAGTSAYPLPENFLQGLYFRDVERDVYMEELPPRTIREADDGLSHTDGARDRFSLATVQGIQSQPATAGTVTVATSGGTELAANQIVVQGLDATGAWVEETLSSGSTWTNLTSTTSFAQISNIIKVGSSWTRTITVSRGITLLTLLAAEYTKEYRLFELDQSPVQPFSVEYRYYKKVIPLQYDNQALQVPEQFVDIVLYDALVNLQGYTRATSNELQIWAELRRKLYDNMKQTYQNARTLGGRARYVLFAQR